MGKLTVILAMSAAGLSPLVTPLQAQDRPRRTELLLDAAPADSVRCGGLTVQFARFFRDNSMLSVNNRRYWSGRHAIDIWVSNQGDSTTTYDPRLFRAVNRFNAQLEFWTARTIASHVVARHRTGPDPDIALVQSGATEVAWRHEYSSGPVPPRAQGGRRILVPDDERDLDDGVVLYCGDRRLGLLHRQGSSPPAEAPLVPAAATELRLDSVLADSVRCGGLKVQFVRVFLDGALPELGTADTNVIDLRVWNTGASAATYDPGMFSATTADGRRFGFMSNEVLAADIARRRPTPGVRAGAAGPDVDRLIQSHAARARPEFATTRILPGVSPARRILVPDSNVDVRSGITMSCGDTRLGLLGVPGYRGLQRVVASAVAAVEEGKRDLQQAARSLVPGRGTTDTAAPAAGAAVTLADNAQCGRWLEQHDITPYSSWGSLPPDQQRVWDASDCNHKICQYLKDRYAVVPHRSWGTLPPRLQAVWDTRQVNCNLHVR